MKTLAEKVEDARRANRVPLRDLGYDLSASGHGFELKHRDGGGCGFSADYHPDVTETVRLYLMGVEAGIGLGRRGAAVKTGWDRYEEAMQRAHEIWCPELQLLHAAGFANADVTQTGGMCLAIQIPLKGDAYVLITNYDDILPWDREDRTGWCVGIYEGDAEEGTIIYNAEDSDESDTETMIAALKAYVAEKGL